MRTSQVAELQRLGVRTITTAQAAAAWKVSTSAATKTLKELSRTGLIELLRRGLWLLARDATVESLAGDITAPYPSYVSHVSALYTHGIIDQVPAEVHLVSVAKARRITTSRGTFRLHRMPQKLIGGYQLVRDVQLASPEKALFDWAYLSVAAGHPTARLPETEWPQLFRRGQIDLWLRRIDSQRITTMTAALIDRRLAQR